MHAWTGIFSSSTDNYVFFDNFLQNNPVSRQETSCLAMHRSIFISSANVLNVNVSRSQCFDIGTHCLAMLNNQVNASHLLKDIKPSTSGLN